MKKRMVSMSILVMSFFSVFLGLGTGKPLVAKASHEIEFSQPPAEGLFVGIQPIEIEPSIIANIAYENLVASSQLEVPEEEIAPEEPDLTEDGVYTFFQGPKALSEGLDWSGEWAHYSVQGNTFGSFGCGLVVMANIYDTVSPYETSPLDMFEYAKDHTGYYPTGQAGAIDWNQMQEGLQTLGVNGELGIKPDSYGEFQNLVEGSESLIALVASANDDSYWTSTAGHYVTLWLYDRENDTVFIGDSGSPEHNRQRIPLQYVYDAMKTGSQYQYMSISGYDENSNQTKLNEDTAVWNRPQE